jgi:hypothetical protein
MYLDDEEGVRSCRSSGVAESGVEVRIEEGCGKVAGSRRFAGTTGKRPRTRTRTIIPRYNGGWVHLGCSKTGEPERAIMIDAKIGQREPVAIQNVASREECPLNKASKKGLYG